MGLMLEGSLWFTDGREVLGLGAGFAAAMLAGQAGWKATDWLMSRRADPEG